MSSEPLTLLMVAEKPSIAKAIAEALSPNGIAQKRKGISPSAPVFEVSGVWLPVGGTRLHTNLRVTSTVGHMWSLDFPKEYNDQNKVEPLDLFDAPTAHFEDPYPRMSAHLWQEAAGADALVLWLDCDREGDNICFEVIQSCRDNLTPTDLPGAYEGNVYRAHFSSLAPDDLRASFALLGHPDLNASRSVDARQLIDLKLGVTFSRFQTRFFRQHLGHQLGKLSVTYGPCQSPTLWFCCHRHDQIATFVPQPYWSVRATAQLANGAACKLTASKGDVWTEAEAQTLVSASSRDGEPPAATATGAATISTRRLSRPLPLNTVALLKAASERLHIGAGDAMHYAERLYLNGLTSYPRTETSKYAAGFDLHGTLSTLSSAEWLPEASSLLGETGQDAATATNLHGRARDDGVDVGDHPPITPVKLATAKACGDPAAWELYKFICRHFVSTLSDDCELEDADVSLSIGWAAFDGSATRCARPGWLTVLELTPFGSDDDTAKREAVFKGIASVKAGASLPVLSAPSVHTHWTQPPRHLSEAELLSLMEEHGIGTDASMATHVSNVIRRGFVQLDEATRELVPAPLGLALVHSYALIDEGLVLPCVRASIEAACGRIAAGTATFEQVTNEALQRFRARFIHFGKHAHRLPSMLAAALSMDAGLQEADSNASWREAVRKTAAVNLNDLKNPSHPRVLAAIRGPTGTAGTAGPAPPRPPGLAAPVEVEKEKEEEEEAPPPSAEARAAEEAAAIAAAREQLERLGYGAATPPAPKEKPPPPPANEQQQQQQQQQQQPSAEAAGGGSKSSKRGGKKKNKGGKERNSEQEGGTGVGAPPGWQGAPPSQPMQPPPPSQPLYGQPPPPYQPYYGQQQWAPPPPPPPGLLPPGMLPPGMHPQHMMPPPPPGFGAPGMLMHPPGGYFAVPPQHPMMAGGYPPPGQMMPPSASAGGWMPSYGAGPPPNMGGGSGNRGRRQ